MVLSPGRDQKPGCQERICGYPWHQPPLRRLGYLLTRTAPVGRAQERHFESWLSRCTYIQISPQHKASEAPASRQGSSPPIASQGCPTASAEIRRESDDMGPETLSDHTETFTHPAWRFGLLLLFRVRFPPPKDLLVSSMKRCLSGGWISSFPAARHGAGFSGIHRCATSIICRLLVEVPSPKSAILHLSGVSADEAALNQYGRSIKDVSCSAFPSRVIHFSQGLERVRPRSFVGREMSGGYFP
jgi:hypothetical protein